MESSHVSSNDQEEVIRPLEATIAPQETELAPNPENEEALVGTPVSEPPYKCSHSVVALVGLPFLVVVIVAMVLGLLHMNRDQSPTPVDISPWGDAGC